MAAKKKSTATLDEAMRGAMEKPAASPDLLNRIVAAASELAAAVSTVKVLEEKLEKAKGDVFRLRTTALPQLMDEAGVPGLDIDELTRVERETEIYASISSANKQAAAAWLRANDLGSVIKESILIPIDKGDTERVKQITSVLVKARISYAEDSSVHASTLKALVRERIEAGKEIPACITHHTLPVVNVKPIKLKKRKA